jgi:hypothetical protein
MLRSVARHVGRPVIPTSHHRLGGELIRRNERQTPIRPTQKKRSLTLVSSEARQKSLHMPQERTIRKVAWLAATEQEWKHSNRIHRFGRVLRTYCGLVLGYQDRTVVGTYTYLHLKRFAANEKSEGRSVYRKELEHEAAALFRKIEAWILDTAASSRRVKVDLPRNRFAVRAPIGEGNGRKCFLICERDHTERIHVNAFQTAKQFNRRKRTRMRMRQEYRNDHPRRRRSETIH